MAILFSFEWKRKNKQTNKENLIQACITELDLFAQQVSVTLSKQKKKKNNNNNNKKKHILPPYNSSKEVGASNIALMSLRTKR